MSVIVSIVPGGNSSVEIGEEVGGSPEELKLGLGLGADERENAAHVQVLLEEKCELELGGKEEEISSRRTERKVAENEIRWSNKRVEFSAEVVRMELAGNHIKRREDGSAAPNNGTGTPTPSQKRRSSPSGALMNEIRKMSLASQDAKEEKKSPKKVFARRFGRRRKRREEEYTDKDRAAAVTLGSRDIKQSLKAKKKRERKLCLSLELMNSEDFLTTMLVNEALAQLRLKKPKMALATLNKALELQPNNKGALVARSQCHLKLGEAELALKDAETSFDKNDPYIMGLFQYAEALYNLGQFEKALISYHKGFRLRQDMTGFRIGIQKCQEAIQRAIGDHKATQIEDLDAILPFIDEIEALKNQRKGQTHPTFGPGKDETDLYRRKLGNKLKIQSKSRVRWVERECLGQMFLDKDYFTKFLDRPDIQNGDGAAHQLKDNASDALNYFETRQQFWRQQNPIYARKVGLNLNSNVILKYEEHDREQRHGSARLHNTKIPTEHEEIRLKKLHSTIDAAQTSQNNNISHNISQNISGRKSQTPTKPRANITSNATQIMSESQSARLSSVRISQKK